MDINQITIDSLGLSVRSYNALKKSDIIYVKDLICMSEEELYAIPHLGKKSVEEILEIITKYKIYLAGKSNQGLTDEEKYRQWLQTEEAHSYVIRYLEERNANIRDLSMLSTKTFNRLLMYDIYSLSKIIFLNENQLKEKLRCDDITAAEIYKSCQYYLDKQQDTFSSQWDNDQDLEDMFEKIIPEIIEETDFHSELYKGKNRESVSQYIKANDISVNNLNMTTTLKNILIRADCKNISDLFFKDEQEIRRILNYSQRHIESLNATIAQYINDHEDHLRKIIEGDLSVIYNDDSIKRRILGLYKSIGFSGLNFKEFKEKLTFGDTVSDKRLKQLIGQLIAEGELEYVDFRCYRIYPKFKEYLEQATEITQRNKEMILTRLEGHTLEETGKQFDLSRERVRQVVVKEVTKLREDLGCKYFDEDYYQYLYETYDFDKNDAVKWLGMEPHVFTYLDTCNVKHGKKDLQEALNDKEHIDAALRIKIKNYLNRNKIFIDNRWVEKKWKSIFNIVVQKYAKNDISYSDLIEKYNQFLNKYDISEDDSLYFEKSGSSSKKNQIVEFRNILWKQNEMIRYYDIEAHDYTELLETLNLDSYHDVEISTLKWIDDYPEIMKKYDIRNQYELHNLLRKLDKITPFDNLTLLRTPTVSFGKANRDNQLFDLIKMNSPINKYDLCTLIRKEYGFEEATMEAYITTAFKKYYHNEEFNVNQKQMSEENRKLLLSVLADDFYYIDEIQKIFKQTLPTCDQEELNPYNLKTMGFSIHSKYILRNHPSAHAYFTNLLTSEDIFDITSLSARYGYIMMYSQVLTDLRKNLDIIEFEPKKYINIRKLNAGGVTKDDLYDFCDQIADFTENQSYFSIKSIKNAGFESDLFDLGFDDWFYGSILISDSRFTYTQVFNTIIFYKGDNDITIKSLLLELIGKYKSIDIYDLKNDLISTYGCELNDNSKILGKIADTEIYYDQILQRLYANEELYYRELDEAEEL